MSFRNTHFISVLVVCEFDWWIFRQPHAKHVSHHTRRLLRHANFWRRFFFKKLTHLNFITLSLVIFNGSFDKEDVILLQSKINNDMLIFREKRHQKTETLQYLTKRKIRDLKKPTKNWLIHTTSDVITIFNSLCLLVPLCVSLISIH